MFQNGYIRQKDYTRKVAELSRPDRAEERRKGSNPNGATYVGEIPWGEPCEADRDVSGLLAEGAEGGRIPCWEAAMYDYHGRLYCQHCFDSRVRGETSELTEEKMKAAMMEMRKKYYSMQQSKPGKWAGIQGIGGALGGVFGGGSGKGSPFSGLTGGASVPGSGIVQP